MDGWLATQLSIISRLYYEDASYVIPTSYSLARYVGCCLLAVEMKKKNQKKSSRLVSYAKISNFVLCCIYATLTTEVIRCPRDASETTDLDPPKILLTSLDKFGSLPITTSHLVTLGS